GLSVFNRASNSCLASRIPHGIKVTYQRLKKIENSEIIVKSLFNISQVRVRDHSDIARIEVPKEELAKMFDVDKLHLLDIQIKKLGFKFVAIDTAGYRPGSLALL
ncbi:MAG TPA: TIGR00268 family protein, partial [Nitrososphaeraceae archaeon]